MSTPRLLQQLVPLILMLSAIALFTSALFRAHDVPITELDISNRWLSRSRKSASSVDQQPQLRSEEDSAAANGIDHGGPSQEGLTGESGLLVDATEKDWATDDLTDADLSPENIDSILKTE